MPGKSRWLQDLLDKVGIGNPLYTFIDMLRKQGYTEQDIKRRVMDASRREGWGNDIQHPITGDPVHEREYWADDTEEDDDD